MIELVKDEPASQNGMERFRLINKLTGEAGGLVSKGVTIGPGVLVPFDSKIDNRGYEKGTKLIITRDTKIEDGVIIVIHSSSTPMSTIIITDTEFEKDARVGLTPITSTTQGSEAIRVLKNCVFGEDSISKIRGDFFTIDGLYVGESSNVDIVTKISKFNEAHNSGNPIRGNYIRVKDVKFIDNCEVMLKIIEGRLILDNVKLGSKSTLIAVDITSLIMKDVSICSDCQIDMSDPNMEADERFNGFRDMVIEDCEIDADSLEIEVNKSVELYGPREIYKQGGNFSVPEN